MQHINIESAPVVARSEEIRPYLIEQARENEDAEQSIINQALSILGRRLKSGPVFGSPSSIKEYLCLKNAPHDVRGREVFSVLFLTSQLQLIEHRELFFGTLTQTSVYPREVVKAVLELNASSVVLVHNHPSGHAEPSHSDNSLTQILKSALSLVDVRIIDHIITAGNQTVSMAEKGLV